VAEINAQGVAAVADETPPPGPKYQKIPWKNLDNFSHIQFLKVSYVVLVLIPFLALVQH
jgi:hypothetical protein